MEEIRTYGDIVLLNIEDERKTDEIPFGITHIREKLPSTLENQLAMREDGFFLADRMLCTTINLRRSKIDYEKLVRLEVKQTSEYREEFRAIAHKSFPVDRRFHISVEYNEELANTIIDQWIDGLDEWLVCMYKNLPVGFLALKEQDEKNIEIYLAAVDEKYRLTGAAISLYAKAAQMCKEKGYMNLLGWISTVNTPVMNLYSGLGAAFSKPMDIFLKEL
ncbi:MAG: GNAT family N-acetyltransferase [Clostridium sp.]|nr:GNAT family N-acetyltransferase [Clostridium sp.]